MMMMMMMTMTMTTMMMMPMPDAVADADADADADDADDAVINLTAAGLSTVNICEELKESAGFAMCIMMKWGRAMGRVPRIPGADSLSERCGAYLAQRSLTYFLFPKG